MCWMTARTGADALAEAVRDARDHERRNGHSWGWAWTGPDGLDIRRGLGRMPPASEAPYADSALVHTRRATRGAVTVENAHPFPVNRGAALAHNGTWREAPRVDGWSDTRVMADVLSRTLRRRPDDGFGECFRALGEHTGETMLALRGDGTVWVHAGRYEITRDGPVVASSGHEPMDPGVHRVGRGVKAP